MRVVCFNPSKASKILTKFKEINMHACEADSALRVCLIVIT